MKSLIFGRIAIFRSLLIASCAIALWCSVPTVTASDFGNSSNGNIAAFDLVEQIRKSALSGSAASQYELGQLYEYGRGVEQDDSAAVLWYGKSADQNYASAQYRLAVLVDNGWGHPVDKEKAFGLYESAAERGHELAQHDTAIMYFKGSGVHKDLVQAYKWLKIAELSGNPLMQKHLRRVAKEMSADEIKKAEYFAKHWIKEPGI